MWQKEFQAYRDRGFTVVGIALDAEGIPPAKLYYEKYAVTFPALVDPNYATGFGAVPKTFFVDEHGVVQTLDGWQSRLAPADKFRPVTAAIRQQWTEPGQRLDPASIATLVQKHQADPSDLGPAVELASRYLELDLSREARGILQSVISHYRPKEVARAGDRQTSALLAKAYFQLSRACEGNRQEQVDYATLAFYLSPSVGYGKQIARIIDPAKFDHRPAGDFDNDFREGTLRRLQRERDEWLREPSSGQ